MDEELMNGYMDFLVNEGMNMFAVIIALDSPG